MVNLIANLQNYPRSIFTAMVAMILAGIVAYTSLPKEAQPDIDVPVFYISIGQQGVSTEDSERLLVKPMETALRGLDGLKEITAIASEGHAGIVLEFDINFEKDSALADIRDKVDQAKADLPEAANEPQIFETNFALVPTIVVALSGDVPEKTLYKHAKQLQDEIEALPQILEANLSGDREELLEIIIDSSKLESYNISQQELINAVSLNNRLIAAGFLDQGDGRFNIKVPGLFESPQDVMELPIKVQGDAVITLADVATGRQTFKDATSFTRVNGKPGIAINVVKRLGENVIETNEAVRQTVADFTEEWPDVIETTFMLDQSKFIKEVQGSLESSILTAIFLVMILVVAAMGLRASLLVGFAIPASFMVGFLIVALMGMTVNMMVMFGLVLTVGMLVDGAIVIVEYADRRLSEGATPKEAYQDAIKRMFWPIFSSTATTLAAFIPMLLWPGISGEFMSYLPVMVIIVLSASFITAMVFLPATGALSAQLVSFVARVFLKRKVNYVDSEEKRLITDDKKFNRKSVSGVLAVYTSILRFFTHNPAMPFALLFILGVITVVTFTAFGQNNEGVEFFVNEEPEVGFVFVSARGNISPMKARDLTIQVEDRILKIEGVKAVYTEIGSSGGGVQIGEAQDKPVDSVAQISVELADYSTRRKAEKIFEEIRTSTQDLAGINVEIRKQEGGPPTGKDLRLQISSTNYDKVADATARIRSYFQSELGDVRDVEDSRPLPGIEWKLKVDRKEAGRFGTSVAEVGTMIQLVTNGVLTGTYSPDDSDEEIDIRVRLPETERSFNDLDNLNVITPNGLVPLRNFVTREAQPKVSSITRKDGIYTMDVKANVNTGVIPDDKVKEINLWLDEQAWPNGVNFTFRGADEDQKEVAEFMPKAGAAAIFIIFIILVTQFNNFYQTFLTLSTVGMSIVGVLIGMMITGQKFSFIMTSTGIVALAGIVVNNAIVLIDTYNGLRKEGIAPRDAMLATCVQRVRPVLLTTITTIAGLIPMATEMSFDFVAPAVTIGSITSIWWVQLSTAIISGLAFSTLLTLLVIPVMLVYPSMLYGSAIGSGKNIWAFSLLLKGKYFAYKEAKKREKDAAQQENSIDEEEEIDSETIIDDNKVISLEEEKKLKAENKPSSSSNMLDAAE